jgi:uncharacterized protein
VSVVADSSPLIILAKLDCFHLLNRIFTRIYISPDVYREVVVTGAKRPGASEVETAKWIEVKPLPDQAAVQAAQTKYSLGSGELSTILLAKEMKASAVLLDDYSARKLAKAEGLVVRGTVGLLEAFHLRGYLADLRSVFLQLLEHSYVDQHLLNRRLQSLNLPPI